MRCRATIASLLLAGGLSAGEARAEAWGRADGETLLIATALYSRATARIGSDVPIDFEKGGLRIYREAGYGGGWTLVQRLTARYAREDEFGARGAGGESEFGVRFAPSAGPFAWSLGASVGLGEETPLASEIAAAYDGPSGEIVGAVGWGAPGWFANAAFGRRFIEGPGLDRTRFDAVYGFRPNANWEANVKSLSTWRNAGGGFEGDEFHKAEATAIRLIGNWSIEFGIGRTYAGEGAPRETYGLVGFHRRGTRAGRGLSRGGA